MTKKDFEAIAAVLKDAMPAEPKHFVGTDAYESRGREVMWRRVVLDMARLCERQSARFDRERFLTACGL